VAIFFFDEITLAGHGILLHIARSGEEILKSFFAKKDGKQWHHWSPVTSHHSKRCDRDETKIYGWIKWDWKRLLLYLPAW